METSLAAIVITEEDKLKQLALSDLERARALQVTDNESYRDCCMMEMQIKESIKTAEEKMEPVIVSTRKAWKSALKLLADIVAPANEALGYVQDKRVGFEDRQKKKAIEDQQAKTQEALEQAKQVAEKVATVLESSGEQELAEQVRGNVQAPVVNVEPDIPKVKGIETNEKWFYNVIDAAKIARSYLMLDDKKIQGLVNSQHRDAEKIVGGIEVYSKDVPRGAAKR